MSSKKHETIADIVAEMRNDVDNEEKYNRYDLHEWGTDIIRLLANRIEAAHQREVAELRECLKETMADAVAEYKNNSCFRNVKCGEIERCKTCKVDKWRKALRKEGSEK